jgi:hypothetical protein
MTLRRLATAHARPKWKLYNTIDFLPVRNFYMTVETGDKRWLLRGIDYENLPPCTIDLDPTWDKIWSEFIAISGDRDYQIYFETVRRLAVLESKYEYLKAEIYVLYFRAKQEYIDDLLAEGITIDMTDREHYLESLNIAAQRLRSYETKIALLAKELEARNQKKGKSNFEDLVDSVERYRGQAIDIDTMSIKRFALMLNKIKQENVQRKN